VSTKAGQLHIRRVREIGRSVRVARIAHSDVSAIADVLGRHSCSAPSDAVVPLRSCAFRVAPTSIVRV
jgi:hypothetical protein